jgi:hypothetical protein
VSYLRSGRPKLRRHQSERQKKVEQSYESRTLTHCRALVLFDAVFAANQLAVAQQQQQQQDASPGAGGIVPQPVLLVRGNVLAPLCHNHLQRALLYASDGIDVLYEYGQLRAE